MLNPLKLIAIGAALINAAAAVGHARVVNKCNFQVTLWSVGSSVSNAHTLKHGGTYVEEFVRDPKTGGKALKITRGPKGLYNGKPQTNFAYSLDGATVWYDLSDVFGDPFSGHKLVVASAKASCPKIVWPNGVPPAGSQVKDCTSASDVTLTLCAS